MVIHKAFASADKGDSKKMGKAMKAMFGPAAVDQQIRAAISTCWMMLPEKKRTPEAVAAQIRRITERALKNLADDAREFEFRTLSR